MLTDRTILIEPDGGPGDGVLAMDPAGDVEWYASPAEALGAIRADDRRSARKGVSTVTTIEWTDMPEDFTPPELAR